MLRIGKVFDYAVPPTVTSSIRNVGWPTPTGTLWPSLPQTPTPGSRRMSLPIIENGKVTYPVKGATLIGNGPDVLNRVSMIGNDMRLDPGVGVCGKDGQSVPVGVGQPTLRIEDVTVGGTA